MSDGAIVTEATLTQNAAILDYLNTHGEIDKKIAMKICDCDRLSARIYDLRHRYGANIVTDRREKKNRMGHRVSYAVYKLVREDCPF